MSGAWRQDTNSRPPPALKEATNEPKRQRVQHDEVEAAAQFQRKWWWLVGDETLAAVGVIKNATALTLGHDARCWKAWTQSNIYVSREGGRGDVSVGRVR